MPKLKMLMMIASTLVVVGIVGVLFTFKSAGAGEEINDTKVIQNPNITEVSVESENATILVLPTSDDLISVTFEAKESKYDKYKFDINEEGDTLSIELKEKTIRFINFHLDFDFSGPKITVYLPEKQYEELIVDNINGKINVDSINVDNINAKTVNGRIEIEETNTNSTTVSSENGSVILKHVNGDITSDLVNGSTTFITDNLNRSIDLESVNGKITVQTTEEPTNATIEVDVVNGKVSVFENDTRSMVYGNGEHKIQLKTVNGSVTVSK
ncbi:DUF4097 family beta strand repeat-containing protein [Ornithinibacillus halotolerans]|uniref:DUF4097 domain-containing protein n=1 Tax=Ornithinibacillus halotolerans TaxID=1274357 RepID=A0A916W932_9BACI|nr:DUF4097 family beta strand repeat-containing protein [Ornithinibacillus halotolerans]GGA78286.1 hypothetical protein GCM10008025_22210 [Ornithinibacillus halotolerans]